MTREQTAQQAAAVARRGIQWWADRCNRSASTALLSAVAVGFLAGMVLRVFERRK